MATMTRVQRRHAAEDLGPDLAGRFPGLGVGDRLAVVALARKLAARHHEGEPFEALLVGSVRDGDWPCVHVVDEGAPGRLAGLLSRDGEELIGALVHALRELRVPARRRGTRLAECGGCGCYHPADWHGDCRDDGRRFPPPADPDDIAFELDDPANDIE
jgi:hypothetical protein